MARPVGHPPLTRAPLIHLREWRHWRALTQKELAEAAGVAVNTVSRLELHLFGARPDVRRKLAKALGIEPHQLLVIPPGYPGLESAQEVSGAAQELYLSRMDDHGHYPRAGQPLAKEPSYGGCVCRLRCGGLREP